MTYTKFYNTAYQFLLAHLPTGITESSLQRYFVPEREGFSSITDVFEGFIESAQTQQMLPNVIKFKERHKQIKKILCNFNVARIIKTWDANTLYKEFRRQFNITSTDSPKNCWYRWSEAVISIAKFLSSFKDANDFRGFIASFGYNAKTKMALPLLISTRIKGMGFSLVCNALKELGYSEYPKPDVHLKDVISTAGFCEHDDYAVFETIVNISNEMQKNGDTTATPYKIDKIIWLICSGNFYLDNIDGKSWKREFVDEVKNGQPEYI
jgi:hypothetical protein